MNWRIFCGNKSCALGR